MRTWKSAIWDLCHLLVVLAALTFLLLPQLRELAAARHAMLLLYVAYVIPQAWQWHKDGTNHLSPGEIYRGLQTGKLKPVTSLELMASVFGTVAAIMAMSHG